MFFFFLFLYTTRKGWFVFLACLKTVSKRTTKKREARLDFVDVRYIHNREDEDGQTKQFVTTRPFCCLLCVHMQHVCTKPQSEEKKKQMLKQTKRQPTLPITHLGKGLRDPKKLPSHRRSCDIFTTSFQEVLLQRDTLNMEQSASELLTWAYISHTCSPQQPRKKCAHASSTACGA